MPKITPEQAASELLPLFRKWADAVSTVKEYPFLDRHLSDGWLYTDFQGVERGKDAYYQLVDNIVSYKQEFLKFNARMVGDDVAIAFGVYRALAELKDGSKGDNTIAFSSVWQFQDGVWKAFLHHTTKIAEPSSVWPR